MGKKVGISVDAWEGKHYKRVNKYARQIDDIFSTLSQETGIIGASVSNFNQNKPFTFADYPGTKQRIDKLLSNLQNNISLVINDGTREEWLLACRKNDEIVKKVFDNQKLDKVRLEHYYSRNLEALDAFQKRKVNGMNLSDRVWNLTDQTKQELEMSIDLGLTSGKSAAEMSREIKKHLNDPNKLFRRVKDERGQLQLSRNAKAYHPGQGVYRSSKANAMRLTRTETNMAYRASDNERWNQLDFILGYEIKRSNNPYPCPVCEALQGKYPKTFKFVGWHPNCRCYQVPILADLDDFLDYETKILDGEDVSDHKFKDEIVSIPDNFKKWVNTNQNKLITAKSEPHFIRDNRSLVFDKQAYTLKRTKVYEPQFSKTSKEIAERLNISVCDTNIKSEKRIVEKANNDYGGDTSKVKDIVRNTFLATEDKQKILTKEIQKHFKIDRIKQQLAETDGLGYSGTIINVKFPNGTYGEIQMNSASVLFGKDLSAKHILGDKLFDEIKRKSGLEPGLGHKYYEEYRTLDPVKDALRKAELEKLSREYYDKLRSLKL